MIAPASQDIAQHLEDQGLGVLGSTNGWRIAVAVEAARPDTCLTVYDSGGGAPVLYTEELLSEEIQIRTRAFAFASAYDKQTATFAVLNAVVNQVIYSARYLGIWRTSGPMYIGRDDSDAHLFTSNYRVERHEL